MRFFLNQIRRRKRTYFLIGALIVCIPLLYYVGMVEPTGTTKSHTSNHDILHKIGSAGFKNGNTSNIGSMIVNLVRSKVAVGTFAGGKPNYNAHIFYYGWYGIPEVDEKWLHWNHRYLPHWDQSVTDMYPKGRHVPPVDIGANFYPQIGPYSSKNPAVIEHHMQEIRQARIGVISYSWYPPTMSDSEGQPSDLLVPALLDAAAKYDLKLCFHLEPYDGRNASTVHDSIIYIIDNYGNHSAFYRRVSSVAGGIPLPVFYVYDSYKTPAMEWRRVLGRAGSLSLRTTMYDAIFIGLVVESKHQAELYAAGFDGMYTYFASDMFVFGSRPSNWYLIATYCKLHNMLFMPSVGPGYVDTRVRPWNARNRKDREGGDYYDRIFAQALSLAPDAVSITSYNEWHEGTQIESAIPMTTGDGFDYESYAPLAPDAYIQQTRRWIEKMPGTHV